MLVRKIVKHNPHSVWKRHLSRKEEMPFFFTMLTD